MVRFGSEIQPGTFKKKKKKKEIGIFTVSWRGACRTPWSRHRFSSAFYARPFFALRPQELASRRRVPLVHHLHCRHHHHLLFHLHLPLGDGRSPRRHLADHFAPRARSPPLDDEAADLAFDSRRDRHGAINPPPFSFPLAERAHKERECGRWNAHNNYFVRSADFSAVATRG